MTAQLTVGGIHVSGASGPDAALVSGVELHSLARQTLRCVYCHGAVVLKNPCAYRRGRDPWDVMTWPAGSGGDVVAGAATVRHSQDGILPRVDVCVEMDVQVDGRDPAEVVEAVGRVVGAEENKMYFPVLDVAMEMGARKIINPAGRDIYEYAALAAHEYFYDRGKQLTNILGVDEDTVLLIGYKDEVGRLYIFREWNFQKAGGRIVKATASLGFVVYPDSILGIGGKKKRK